TLADFRAWTHSATFPESPRIDYLGGELWVDLTMEEFYLHNAIKTEIIAVLQALVHRSQTGRVVSDRMRFSYPGAECWSSLTVCSCPMNRCGQIAFAACRALVAVSWSLKAAPKWC